MAFSLPSENDPVYGRNGSPLGYFQLGWEALQPSNIRPFMDANFGPAPIMAPDDDAYKSPLQQIPEGLAKIFSPGGKGSTDSGKVNPPESRAQDPDEEDFKERIKPLKSNDFDRIVDVIQRYGVSPNDPKFMEYLGASARQNGMIPSANLGPLAAIRDKFFPDAIKLQQRQAALREMGTVIWNQLAAQKLAALQGPQTLADAQRQGVGGIIAPTPDQLMEAPRRGDMVDMQGPMPGVVNPNAQLTTNQIQQIQPYLKSIAAGHIMPVEGNLVPTSYASIAPKMLTDDVIQWANQAVTTPIGQDLPPAPRNAPPTLVNKILEERGLRQRQQEKPVDLNNALESLTIQETAKDPRFGRPLTFKELAAADPAMAERVRKQAEITEKKDLYTFQTDEQIKKAIATAYPVAKAGKEAEQDMPVAEPQLWRDPLTGEAADPQLTQREARKRKMVKLRPDQVETFNQMATIDDGLETIKEIARDLFKPEANSPAGKVLRMAGQKAYIGYLRLLGDERINLLDSIVSRLTAPMVKSQGDTANIAVAERDLFAKALVNDKASLESILKNLDNIQAAVKKARALMGFKTPEQYIQALHDAGKSDEEIKAILKQKGL